MFTQQEWDIMQSRQKRFDYVEVGFVTRRLSKNAKNIAKGAARGTKKEKKMLRALGKTGEKILKKIGKKKKK